MRTLLLGLSALVLLLASSVYASETQCFTIDSFLGNSAGQRPNGWIHKYTLPILEKDGKESGFYLEVFDVNQDFNGPDEKYVIGLFDGMCFIDQRFSASEEQIRDYIQFLIGLEQPVVTPSSYRV